MGYAMTKQTIPPLQRALLTVAETCTVLGCGKKLFWGDYAKKLELVGSERKRWITVVSILRLVSQLQEAAAAPSEPGPLARGRLLALRRRQARERAGASKLSAGRKAEANKAAWPDNETAPLVTAPLAR